MPERWPWLGLALVLVALDQATKAWVVASLPEGGLRPVLPWFNLVLVYNTGAAFNFLDGAGGWQRWLFALVAMAVAGLLTVWLWRLPAGQWRLGAALGLILGGALGNLVDRLTLGRVVDFIDWHYQAWHWPAFNLADAGISLGVVLLFWDMLRPRGRQGGGGGDGR